MTISQSAQLYQERKGLVTTLRGPGPIYDLKNNPVNSYPLKPPNPNPELQHEAPGMHPPDDVATQVWPFGGTG